MRRLAVPLLCLLASCGAARADDNAIAYRLFTEARFGEAAEIFTDPAWKGVAFYRSEQYWRAAEAFVRADDPVSAYNLGNTYARLSYYELALAAYLDALERRPQLSDAAVNADLMRKLIADQQSGKGGLQPEAREIDKVEAKDRPKDGSGGKGDEHGKAEEQKASAERDRSRSSSDRQGQTQTSEGRSGSGTRRDEQAGAAGEERIEGTAGKRDAAAKEASGGSEAEGEAASDQAAGMRTRLEAEQATRQWLNRIVDRPERFLKARIELEARRRKESGTAPETGADAW
jgi:Ca-activated chloride channel family protein